MGGLLLAIPESMYKKISRTAPRKYIYIGQSGLANQIHGDPIEINKSPHNTTTPRFFSGFSFCPGNLFGNIAIRQEIFSNQHKKGLRVAVGLFTSPSRG